MTKTIKKGFTIIELLIVIVVIGILAAIVVVTYQGVQNKANKTAAEQNAREVANKATAYNASASRFPETVTDLKSATYDGKTFPEAKLSEKVDGLVTKDDVTATTKTKVQYRVCKDNSSGDFVGAKIYFWNYESNAASTDAEAIKAGTTTGAVTCAAPAS